VAAMTQKENVDTPAAPRVIYRTGTGKLIDHKPGEKPGAQAEKPAAAEKKTIAKAAEKAAPPEPPVPPGEPSVSVELATNLPMPPSQRGPTKKETESGTAVVAKGLAPQLGSAPAFTAAMQIDERKMAVLNDYTQTALGYFRYRGKADGVRFFAFFTDWELASSQALNALARRHILEALRAATGSSVTSVAEKPNILARNVWRRSWKGDAVREGKEVVE